MLPHAIVTNCSICDGPFKTKFLMYSQDPERMCTRCFKLLCDKQYAWTVDESLALFYIMIDLEGA